MPTTTLVSNERQARDLESELEKITQALSSEQTLKSIIDGLPKVAIEGIRRSLVTEKEELSGRLAAFRAALAGDAEPMRRQVGSDLGDLLIVARLALNWKQKDLARRIGLPEQAIQRWEAERYRNINLANFIKVARALSVDFSAEFQSSRVPKWFTPPDLEATEIQKILRHARKHGWLDGPDADDVDGGKRFVRSLAEHVGRHGTPSLLRTGINVKHDAEDWMLLAWKAQVTRRAESIIASGRISYRALDLTWLKELVKLSASANGPLLAQSFLKEHGIVLLAERNIPGMEVDGAAFLVDGVPVIGMTLRRNTLDNFWFTLLHEVAHVVLHFRTGLAAGFFDDTEANEVDEFEAEANRFASDMLVPEELWARSPARIAKVHKPIENLAQQLGISSTIIYGRIRFERKNYTIFSDKIGQGAVQRHFFSEASDE
ncbi:MAG TPA: XRE family transcriptional regulator [Burkholderiaceae bacterium]|nr:XRE family transcriptional regulator [Burkholderiaceae bacterium]